MENENKLRIVDSRAVAAKITEKLIAEMRAIESMPKPYRSGHAEKVRGRIAEMARLLASR